MKKTLLLLLAATSITPVYQCMAAEVVIERYSKPMGRLAKAGILVGLSAACVAGRKVMHWWNKEQAKNVAKAKSPVNYALWEENTPISELWNSKERQAIDLEVVSKKTLPTLKTELEAEQLKLDQVLAQLKPNTPFNAKVDDAAPVVTNPLGEKRLEHTWSVPQLIKYYDHYEEAIEDASIKAKVAAATVCGPLSLTLKGCFNACNYALVQTKRLFTWIAKPAFDQQVAGMYLNRLKQKHRVATLLAIVEDALKNQTGDEASISLAKKLEQEQEEARAAAKRKIAPAQQQTHRDRCTVAPAPVAAIAQLEALEAEQSKLLRQKQEAEDKRDRTDEARIKQECNDAIRIHIEPALARVRQAIATLPA